MLALLRRYKEGMVNCQSYIEIQLAKTMHHSRQRRYLVQSQGNDRRKRIQNYDAY